MVKQALFLEGGCEKIAIRFYLQKNLHLVKVTSDVYEFIDHSDDTSIVLLYDCLGHESVLPKAKEYSSTLWNDTIILVRDLEWVCQVSASLASKEILQEIPQLQNQATKFSLFAAPCLEAIYNCDKPLFQKVMLQLQSKETWWKISSIIIFIRVKRYKLEKSITRFTCFLCIL